MTLLLLLITLATEYCPHRVLHLQFSVRSHLMQRRDPCMDYSAPQPHSYPLATTFPLTRGGSVARDSNLLDILRNIR